MQGQLHAILVEVIIAKRNLKFIFILEKLVIGKRDIPSIMIRNELNGSRWAFFWLMKSRDNG